MKETINTCLNSLSKYRVVDKKGKLIMTFRVKMAAKQWIKENQKYYLNELRLEE